MRILVAVPSPRDLKVFDDALAKLNVDKLIVKYYWEFQAYEIIQQQFLAHKEYTHLCLIADDLIVEQQHLNQLMFDIGVYDFPVVCGLCNLDQSPEHKGMLNVCIDHMPSIARNQNDRSYVWLVEGSEQHLELLANKHPPIIKVLFAGFPCMVIARDVVEQFTFKDDRAPATPGKNIGCCVDVMTCADLHDLEIPIHCDLRVQMNHLKISDSAIEGRQVGIKNPHFYFSLAK